MPGEAEEQVSPAQQVQEQDAGGQDNNIDNHNNQIVNTTNSEEEQQQQGEGEEFVVVTTTNGEDGSVQVAEEQVAEEQVLEQVQEHVVEDDGRTVIVHEEVLKQEVVEFADDGGMVGGISSSETSDAVASVLPGVDGEQVHVASEGAYEEVMDFVEEQVVTAEQVVADDEQVHQHQQEEVVISGENGEQVVFVTDTGRVTVGSNGGGGEVGGDFFVQDADLTGGDAVIQMQEEEIIETPSSETEMSVAMEMAKLSQGGDSAGGAIYTSPNGTIYQTEEVYSNGYSDYDDDRVDSNGVHSTSVILPPTANLSSASNVSKQYKRRSAPVSSTTAPAGPPPVLGADGTEKPKMSYAQLIAEALMSAEDRMLPLAEIYQTINKRYPYYRMDVKSWQNAIRHNLTLNPSFTKIPRPNNEGRGNYWRMEEGSEKVIFRRQIRAAQNRNIMEAKARANAELRQHRQQQRQQQVMQRRPGMAGLGAVGGGGGGGAIQLSTIGSGVSSTSSTGGNVTYQVLTRTPSGQTVVTPAAAPAAASAGPTRFIYVRPGGTAAATSATLTPSNRPTIQLVSPARNASNTIQIVNGAGLSPSKVIKTITVPKSAIASSSSPSIVSATSTPSGPRVMRIKDTIVRQNGSVVFIAMPSNASVIKTAKPVEEVVKEEVFEEDEQQQEEEGSTEDEEAVMEEVVIQDEVGEPQEVKEEVVVAQV